MLVVTLHIWSPISDRVSTLSAVCVIPGIDRPRDRRLPSYPGYNISRCCMSTSLHVGRKQGLLNLDPLWQCLCDSQIDHVFSPKIGLDNEASQGPGQIGSAKAYKYILSLLLLRYPIPDLISQASLLTFLFYPAPWESLFRRFSRHRFVYTFNLIYNVSADRLHLAT